MAVGDISRDSGEKELNIIGKEPHSGVNEPRAKEPKANEPVLKTSSEKKLLK